MDAIKHDFVKYIFNGSRNYRKINKVLVGRITTYGYKERIVKRTAISLNRKTTDYTIRLSICHNYNLVTGMWGAKRGVLRRYIRTKMFVWFLCRAINY